MVHVLRNTRVIGVALHDGIRNPVAGNSRHRVIDFFQCCRPGSEDHGFPLGSNMVNCFEPGDVPRSDFVGGNKLIDEVNRLDVIGAREEIDTDCLRVIGEGFRPFPGKRRVLIHLVDTFTPAGLVGLLTAEFPKPFVADDMVGSKMLELCRISTGSCRQRHQLERAIQVPIVISGNIRDEIRGVFCSQSF